MRRTYHADSALAAEVELSALAVELDHTHPGAAASLRQGMAETLTVLRLGMPVGFHAQRKVSKTRIRNQSGPPMCRPFARRFRP
jgi:hypothetical protein